MSAERRKQDLLRLRALAQRSDGKIRLLAAEGSPVHTIRLELRYRTVISAAYPADAADRTELTLSLLDAYPHVPPGAAITLPAFNPHVYASGRIAWATDGSAPKDSTRSWCVSSRSSRCSRK